MRKEFLRRRNRLQWPDRPVNEETQNFVTFATCDERNFGDAALQHQLLRWGFKEHPICPRDPGKVCRLQNAVRDCAQRVWGVTTNPVGEERWRRVHGRLQHWERYLSKARQSVIGSSAPGRSNKVVVVLLSEANISVGKHCPGLHERTTEETFGVPSVRNHLKGG